MLDLCITSFFYEVLQQIKKTGNFRLTILLILFFWFSREGAFAMDYLCYQGHQRSTKKRHTGKRSEQ
jgi:hypothetical protein